MPEIPALPPEQPAWRTEPLPAGLRWLEVPAQFDSLISPPPSGTEIAIALDDCLSLIKYPRRLAVLRQWTEQWGLHLRLGAQVESITIEGMGRRAYVQVAFYIHESRPGPGEPPLYAQWLEFGDTRGPSGLAWPQGTLVEGPTLLMCVSCGYSTLPLIFDDEELLCTQCAGTCSRSGCNTRINPNWTRCAYHGPRVRCDSCGDTSNEVESFHNRILCLYCAESQCGCCAERRHDDYYHEDYGYICRLCYDQSRFGDLGPSEEVEDRDTNVDDFTIPTIAGRELIRHCGLEIEGGGNPENIIAPLRAAGLTNQRGFNGYHHTSNLNPADNTWWSVEHDGTVDWELVSPRLNMADPADVRSLDTAVRTLRMTVHDGQVSLDMRCGLHIHVSAAAVPVGGAYKLKGYWDYLEDIMFRLGAARWPFHRALTNGGDYTRSTPKNGMNDKLAFARHFERYNDRYYALSFANYFRAFLENCSCGAARYDTWDKCTCDLGKCTFEFRVFNTSANPTKIHAYLALCQALVAKATTGEDIDDIQAALPPMSFEAVIFEKAIPVQREALLMEWEPRLRWMFNELPLTDTEKRSLMYCVENSELNNLDRSFIRSLNPDQFAMEVVL